MTYTVVGTKAGKFTDKKTGEVIEYARLYVNSEFEKSTFEDAPVCIGQQCSEIKVVADQLTGIKVGAKYKIFFNQKGRVEEILPA